MIVLAIDAGSSSLKLVAYDMPDERRIDAASVALAEGSAALDAFVTRLHTRRAPIAAVVHRIVFGGRGARQPEAATEAAVARIESYVRLQPVHLRIELDWLSESRRLLPEVPQWLCYDTAFHEAMPAIAHALPLGEAFGDVRRYGYHGLSYEYVASTPEARGRCIVAHLGNGASLAAMLDGKPVDTTMGFSPLGGIMMGTRPGDLDPGVLLYALEVLGYDAAHIRDLLAKRSGLLGVSHRTADMRELLELERDDLRARDAVELFVYLACKQIGALAAVLGGVDRLIFTGGIGENAREIRERIYARVAYLQAQTFVIEANEALAMCRHVYRANSGAISADSEACPR